MPNVAVLHGYTRSTGGADLDGHFGRDHLAAAMPEPDAVYVCGPPALVAAVREHCPNAVPKASSHRYSRPAGVRRSNLHSPTAASN